MVFRRADPRREQRRTEADVASSERERRRVVVACRKAISDLGGDWSNGERRYRNG